MGVLSWALLTTRRKAYRRRKSPHKETVCCRGKSLWLDLLKAVAIVWIVLNHLIERSLGSPYFANPRPDWPSLAERFRQLEPIRGLGAWALPVDFSGTSGWSGDQGVQTFSHCIWFWAYLGTAPQRCSSRLPVRPFLMSRAKRVLPLWWGAHVVFVLTWAFTGWGISAKDPKLLLSLATIRFTPEMLYFFAPAWWFIGLLVQLYLIYPWLWKQLHRKGH